MDFLNRVLKLLDRILLVAAGVAVLTLMAVATLNVCLRVVHMPFRGAYEVVSFLGAVVIAFALGYTQRRRSHIVVDILSETYPPTLQRLIEAVGLLVSAAFFGIISYVIFRWGMRIAGSGEVSETLKIIHYPFIWCVGIGFAVLTLALFVQFMTTVVAQREVKER
jgi:TRAP-type C4-dicarboxylate transport system permease small subunit